MSKSEKIIPEILPAIAFAFAASAFAFHAASKLKSTCDTARDQVVTALADAARDLRRGDCKSAYQVLESMEGLTRTCPMDPETTRVINENRSAFAEKCLEDK